VIRVADANVAADRDVARRGHLRADGSARRRLRRSRWRAPALLRERGSGGERDYRKCEKNGRCLFHADREASEMPGSDAAAPRLASYFAAQSG
jgi:hypothetical protein